MKTALPLLLLFLCIGCAGQHARAPLPPGITAITAVVTGDEVQDIERRMPAYLADPLAAFEQPEIHAVENDLRLLDLGQADADKLKSDWGKLVGLDLTLQRESLI